ncbi:hypothetical protein SEA_RHYNN_87 [Mycobacterium phage Rhynn]|nr:hypothetical protein SEA_RHYNN_87 [Mycobacterium phage Rhynn]
MNTIPSPVICSDYRDWGIPTLSYSLVCACGCGVVSGASFATAEEAAREPMHGGTRQHPGRAVWNGEVIAA